MPLMNDRLVAAHDYEISSKEREEISYAWEQASRDI
jgi:hypothetical protein